MPSRYRPPILLLPMYRLLLLLLALCTASASLAQTTALRGTVTDARTGEPVIGASVLLLHTSHGAAVRPDGTFSISGVPAGVYAIRFQSIGYEPHVVTDVVLRTQRETELAIRLVPTVVTTEEVVVTGGFFQTDRSNPVSVAVFNPEELRRSPGSGQELARVLSALPGVVSKGEVSQDLMVRGGSPAENGFFIDNIPMPGVAHFQMPGGASNGPIGIVNTDLIGEVSFYTGGFSALYGDRASAIGDIQYREGVRDRVAGDVSLSLGGAGLTLEGPLARGNGSFLLSARRSYLDLIAEAINTGGAPTYSDVQGKFVLDVSPRHQLTFLNIFGASRFLSDEDNARDAGLSSTTEARYRQNTTGVNHRMLWSGGRGVTHTSLSYSWKTDRSGNVLYEINEPEATFDLTNRYLAVRSVSRLNLGESASLDAGVEARRESGEYTYFLRGSTDLAGNIRPDFSRDLTLTGTLASAFGSLTFSPVRIWTLTAGARLEYASYHENLTVDPRFSTTLAVAPRVRLNAALGWYSQLNDRFLLSQYAPNQTLPAFRARHIMGGMQMDLTEDTQLTFEVFDKAYSDVPQLPAGSAFAPLYVPDNGFLAWERPLEATGSAWARGTEVFLQKKMARNLYGMASVAWFRTKYVGFDGQTYNRDFDTRFQSSIIAGYRPNRSYEISARWSYVGERPFTPIDPVASQAAESTVLDLSRINDARMPAYHALYVRADRRYFLKRMHVVTFIELWNTYNRANVAGYAWSPVRDEVIPIEQFSFIPVGGVKIEF